MFFFYFNLTRSQPVYRRCTDTPWSLITLDWGWKMEKREIKKFINNVQDHEDLEHYVDKQKHPSKSLSNTYSTYCMSTSTTDPVHRAKHCPKLSLINCWPDPEQRHEAKKGWKKRRKMVWSCKATMQNTNGKMAWSQPSTRPRLILYNLLLSVPKIKAISSSEMTKQQSIPIKRKLMNRMGGYRTTQHCVDHADHNARKTLTLLTTEKVDWYFLCFTERS